MSTLATSTLADRIRMVNQVTFDKIMARLIKDPGVSWAESQIHPDSLNVIKPQGDLSEQGDQSDLVASR